MKMSKITVLMIAVVAIGIFALPATFSVNTGQHIFKQITPANPDAFCNQCHGGTDSVATEIGLSDVGVYNGGIKVHSTQNCGDCHQLAAGYGAATSGTAKDGTPHAAIIPSCLKCHGNAAAGTKTSTSFNVSAELSASNEAHSPLWANSKAANNVSAANTDDLACLGCHTGVPKSGSIVYDYTITHTYTLNGLTIGQ